MKNLKKYAGLLNDVAPEDHFLAYITPSERDMLLDAGGVKTSTPSGIFAYPPSNDARGQSTGSSSSSNSGGGGRDTGSDYGQFDRAVSQAANNPPSAPSGGGGDNNTVDPGFQRALAEIAYQQQNPVYGDPDPQVDISPQDRDSITSFFDNYKAELKSNPFNLSMLGALKTLYQTTQARNMMSGVPGYEFLGYTGGDGNTTNTAVGGGEQDYINNAISQLPFAMTGQVAPQSMVNQYFANQPTSSLSSSLETSYNNAKSNINNILGITAPSQQFGYSQAPYGSYSSTNMADKPYKDYLTTRGLI
jgi:hypothetical protein